jgi:hypothetical protein
MFEQYDAVTIDAGGIIAVEQRCEPDRDQCDRVREFYVLRQSYAKAIEAGKEDAWHGIQPQHALPGYLAGYDHVVARGEWRQFKEDQGEQSFLYWSEDYQCASEEF